MAVSIIRRESKVLKSLLLKSKSVCLSRRIEIVGHNKSRKIIPKRCIVGLEE